MYTPKVERGWRNPRTPQSLAPLVAPEAVPDGLGRELELELVGGIRIQPVGVGSRVRLGVCHNAIAEILTVGLRSTRYAQRGIPFTTRVLLEGKHAGGTAPNFRAIPSISKTVRLLWCCGAVPAKKIT